MGNYGIGVPMNVRCEGIIVLYHRNSIRGDTVGVFHFERTKANNVKEIFRINFVDDNIKYYCVNHQTSFDTIKTIEPDDEISFNNTDDIINYLYQ